MEFVFKTIWIKQPIAFVKLVIQANIVKLKSTSAMEIRAKMGQLARRPQVHLHAIVRQATQAIYVNTNNTLVIQVHA